MRSRKALYNSISALLLEFISIICGFILPRVILSAFGSTYNGLTTSITQFLSVVTLLRAGVGGVTRAALYRPLAENNVDRVSAIVNATQKFMQKIAWIFAAGLVVFSFVYPLVVRDSFEYWFSFALVLIMGVATFVQYYFAITYQMLLIADQRQYITAIIQSFTLILNLIMSIVLIRYGFCIHFVKLGSAVVYCLNPLITVIYIKRKYKLDKRIAPDNSAISQRWDAFAHQIAAYIQDNTDVMVLTVFSTIAEVSVYSVYYMIANGVKKLLATFTAGIEAMFGNMIALNDYDGLRRNMARIEYILFSVGTIAYSCLFILVVPFVKVYTAGIADANYARPIFALILAVSQFVGCIRTPYQNLIDAAGHFKQTRNSAMIEAAVNITISVLAVFWFGLLGVAIGTLVSTVYRTIYLMMYASKNILKKTTLNSIKRTLVSLLEIASIYFLTKLITNINVTDYFSWLIHAIIVGFVSCIVVLMYSMIFDRKDLFDCTKKILSIIKAR